ncbi:MAG: class I SAM-dependent methyltransferase [Bacteroidia bacterium]|nr:class I SAM-dependent methyltransferase [Bacteroidia bacterium]
MQRRKLVGPFLKYLFTRPSVILKALYHGISSADRKDYVTKRYGMENGLKEISLTDLFPGFRQEVHHFTHLYGTSLPIDMALLKQLASGFRDCAYLEIGTWRGESISNVAEVAKECWSLSLSDKEMHSIGWGEPFTKVQRFFSRDLPNVKHVEGNSMTFDFNSLNRKFDLIFVDGDHRYEAVRNDTEKVFRLLKDDTSIIVWHDYAIQYEHIDWNVFAGILDGAPAEKRNNIYHVSNTLCAIYINRPVKSFSRVYPAVPDKEFTITIQASMLNQS